MATLEFSFKGGRTYVHGTDIFNRTVEYLFKEFSVSAIEKIDLTIHKMSTSDLNIEIFGADQTIDKNKCSAIFRLNANGKDMVAVLSEEHNVIDKRIPYDEELIAENSTIDLERKSITLTARSPFSFMENVVAIHKRLLGKVYPDFQGKWLMSRVNLDNYSSEVGALLPMVRFQKNFNFKLVASEVLHKEKRLGLIFFSSR